MKVIWVPEHDDFRKSDAGDFATCEKLEKIEDWADSNTYKTDSKVTWLTNNMFNNEADWIKFYCRLATPLEIAKLKCEGVL